MRVFLILPAVQFGGSFHPFVQTFRKITRAVGISFLRQADFASAWQLFAFIYVLDKLCSVLKAAVKFFAAWKLNFADEIVWQPSCVILCTWFTVFLGVVVRATLFLPTRPERCLPEACDVHTCSQQRSRQLVAIFSKLRCEHWTEHC